mmetsp:Transcript_37489/g.49291  ORF Transcript_37489/g.49291 Transcript_37489/m.49291 type:complete len:153 (+) Transcript_37489:1338-1796(+)
MKGGRRPKPPEPEVPADPIYRQDPIICGDFTDWKPRVMTTVFDFLQKKEIDDNKLDYRSVFNYLKKNFMFGQGSEIDEFEKCEAHHLNQIEEEMATREKEVFFDWKVMFEKVLPYKKPFFVNSQYVRDMKKDYKEIYIAPVFARSGRHIFVI